MVNDFEFLPYTIGASTWSLQCNPHWSQKGVRAKSTRDEADRVLGLIVFENGSKIKSSEKWSSLFLLIKSAMTIVIPHCLYAICMPACVLLAASCVCPKTPSLLICVKIHPKNTEENKREKGIPSLKSREWKGKETPNASLPANCTLPSPCSSYARRRVFSEMPKQERKKRQNESR